MNLKELHQEKKVVSVITLFKGEKGVTKSIHLSKGAELSRHQSKVPALLICIIGEVMYEDENGIKLTLIQGDFVSIEPDVQHWINSVTDSYLFLIK